MFGVRPKLRCFGTPYLAENDFFYNFGAEASATAAHQLWTLEINTDQIGLYRIGLTTTFSIKNPKN